jgi:hypothetical protein
MNSIDIIKRIDSLIEKGKAAMNGGNGGLAQGGLAIGFRSASLSFIKNLYGEKHPYYTDFNIQVKCSYQSSVDSGINILLSIKAEIENGWLDSYKKLVSAEVFSDFLEMAKYLLDNGYKDPAAVIIGSVLEDHLRFLCRNHSIVVTYTSGGDVKPKKADLLNSDLAKAGVYGVLEQKSVTAWLDLRNKAAHGKYDEYQIEQVNLMYLGVLNFITTTN